MAPSTAVLHLLYGTLVAFETWIRQHPRSYHASVVIASLGTVSSILLLILSSLGIALGAEHLGMHIAGTVDGVPIGHMSPLTATVFVIASSSFLLLLASSPDRLRRVKLASLLAGIVLAISGILTIAYLLGGPLLYGTGTIPPALTTSLAGLALGAALLMSTLPRLRTGDQPRRRAMRGVMAAATVVVIAAAGIVAAGYLYFRHYQNEFRAGVAAQLDAVAELTASQVAHWRQERLNDAAVFLNNESFSGLVQRLIENPSDLEAQAHLQTWLTPTQAAYRYGRVSVLDAQGTERMFVPATDGTAVPSLTARAVAPVLRSRAAALLDLRRDAPDEPVYLTVLVPILGGPDRTDALGVLAMRADPESDLYPILRRWPTASKTGEMDLVRRDGDAALILNDSRFRDGVALRLRIPMENTNSPAVMAIRGRTGIVEGLNDEGVRVTAAVRAIPDSPWFLVARVDSAELFAPLQEPLWLLVGLVGTVLIGLGSVVVVAWQRKEKAHYQSLAQAEQRHGTTLQSIGDAVIATDAAGRVEFLNPVAEALTGWRRDEASGNHLSAVLTIVDEGTGETIEGVVTRTLRGEAAVGLPGGMLVVARDGTTRPIASTAAPIRDGQGKPTGVVLVFRDLTKEREGERILREREEQYRRLFDSIREAILVVDTNRMLLDCNPAAIELFEYQRDEVIGRSTLTLYEGKDEFDRVEEDIRDNTGNQSFTRTLHFKTKSGRRVSGETTVFYVRDGRGDIVGHVALVRDITEKQKAEEQTERLEAQLLGAQRMESIGRLAGGVAHDFNNLLVVILNHAEFALQGLREGDPLRDDMLEVKKAGERAAALTQQLLAFSRRQVLRLVPLDLNEVATEIEKMLVRILGEDIELVLVLAPDLGLTMADPSQIDQVILNLVINARDAMPGGGKLTLETANVELDENQAQEMEVRPGSYVLLAIADTGCGMDEEVKAKIFEPFFTTKEKDKGTGLGLSTVYGIVKQTNGHICVDSEPWQGTTVKVYLPRERSAVANGPTVPSVATPKAGTETILVVEDEEAVRKLAKRILQTAGYTILTAADGVEALLLCESHQDTIHLVLTDIVMPRMGGSELAERLAKVRPETRILYMSGYSPDGLGLHGILDAGVQVVGKPFKAPELIRKVRNVLDAPSSSVGAPQ